MAVENIKKYVFGNPLNTGAVVMEVAQSSGNPEGLSVDQAAKELKTELSKEAFVYGLGETIRGINKRGWLYRSNNRRAPS